MDGNEETRLSVAFPIVNLNGSDRERLVAGYDAALKAVNAALADVIASAPHGRDFQLQPPDDYLRAAKEHVNRVGAMTRVANEPQEILRQVRKQRGRAG